MTKVDVIGKTYLLVVKMVDFQRNKPLKNVNVKVFKLETEPITPGQWAENLKNGAPFKRLLLLANTDNTGVITGELPEGTYEVKIEQYGLRKVFELTQSIEVLFTEPKKLHWWQRH